MFDTLRKSQYKVVSIGALASAVRPRIERSIEREARFPRKVTTKKTLIA